MKLVSYTTPELDESVGIWDEEQEAPYDLIRAFETFAAVNNFEKLPLTNMLDLLSMGLVNVELLNEVNFFVRSTGIIEFLTAHSYRLLAPISRPPAIYALARNYPAHAKESGVDVPKEPVYFIKASTSVIGTESPVIYKNWFIRVDPEAELAVVIGKKGSNISVKNAMDYVAGYTCLNDVTERDIQSKDIANSHPWTRSKGIDTFCPMGPWIVLKDEIPDPGNLDIELKVNGEIRQKDNTCNLTFKIPYLIHWISRFHTLYPGDIISTGTPEGMHPVVPGDLMEVTIDKIGTLSNRVITEKENKAKRKTEIYA